MGKWWWRFRTLESDLWVQVIKSIYGSEGGLDGECPGGWVRNTVWGGIIKIGSELDRLGLEWSSSFKKQVGNWEKTSFWKERWVEGECLMARFPRLYHLEMNKGVSVRERGKFGLNGWEWAWEWSRPLRGRVLREFEELNRLVANVSIIADCMDRWSWELDLEGTFSVSKLRGCIEEAMEANSESVAVEETRWNALIPKKICVFVWRARQDRLPVKVALDRRGIDLNSLLCTRCEDEAENLEHCLLRCGIAKSVWDGVFKWWRWANVDLTSVEGIIMHPGHVMFDNRMRLVWQAVIWVTAYSLWKCRNDHVFNNKLSSSQSVLSGVQVSVFYWINHRCHAGLLNWEKWIIDPMEAVRLLGRG